MSPLNFSVGAWPALMLDLRQRGHGCRESGAFLLGRIGPSARAVHDWLPYDDVDPESLRYDYIRMSTESFARLWAICADREMEVVGDVHTHPRGPGQSDSDRDHPMVSIAGHMALIVPKFAMGNVEPSDVSVNCYLGGGRWSNHFGRQAAALINLP